MADDEITTRDAEEEIKHQHIRAMMETVIGDPTQRRIMQLYKDNLKMRKFR